MGPLLPALLVLALSLAPARAQAPGPEPDGLAFAEQSLVTDRNPYYADEFLKNEELQAAVKRYNPDEEALLVERATRLKDMADLLTAQVSADGMNEALRARLYDDDQNPDAPKLLGFGAHPAELLAWRAKYADYVNADALATALWEWKTLGADQRAWLSGPSNSMTEQTWEASSFTARFKRLRDWAGAQYDRLMKTSPQTPGEFAQMQATQANIWQILDGDQKRLSDEYLTKASSAVDGLAKLKTLPSSVLNSADPAVKDLLAKARAGGSPDDTLAALSRLFDLAGVHDDGVASHAPDRPDQKLSSLDPKVFLPMLANGLLTEISDVDAGGSVAKFFETHPLHLAVGNLGTELAHFDGAGTIAFNERFLTDWIKGQGLTAQQVASNPAEFHELVMILAPVFVHESTHQIQKSWADEHGTYAWNAQHQEIEAKEVQSDYVLEKMLKSKAYRDFLTRTRGHSTYVDEDLNQAAALQRDPNTFRALVMSDYYPGLPSLEATEADGLDHVATGLDALRAEKARRAALAPDARAAIDRAGFDKDRDFNTMAEWTAYLKRVKSSELDVLIADDVKERGKLLKTYELTSARQARVLQHIEDDVRQTSSGVDTSPRSTPPPPPSPGGP